MIKDHVVSQNLFNYPSYSKYYMETYKKDTASLILVVLRFEKPDCVSVYVINVSCILLAGKAVCQADVK